jgi:hypothetical protein
MSTLMDRMSWSDNNVYPSKKIVTHNSPVQIPLMRIQIFPGVISYEDLDPLVTSDGDPITATGNGEWGQLYAAGRM